MAPLLRFEPARSMQSPFIGYHGRQRSGAGRPAPNYCDGQGSAFLGADLFVPDAEGLDELLGLQRHFQRAAGDPVGIFRPSEFVDDVLAVARGLHLAICSNWDWDLDPAVEEVGLAESVDTVMSSAWAGARKPHPRIFERTLDQVILEYLTNEADQEQLVLMVDGEQHLGLGLRAALLLHASSSKTGLPITGAQVSVRMISTVAEPRILASGRTDDMGALPLFFEVPSLDRGTAALIITAISSIGRAELKHLL